MQHKLMDDRSLAANQRAVLCVFIVLLAHLGLGWGFLRHQAEQILAVSLVDIPIMASLATLSKPVEAATPSSKLGANPPVSSKPPVKPQKKISPPSSAPPASVPPTTDSRPHSDPASENPSPGAETASDARMPPGLVDASSEPAGAPNLAVVTTKKSEPADAQEQANKSRDAGEGSAGNGASGTQEKANSLDSDLGKPKAASDEPDAKKNPPPLYAQSLAEFPKPIRLTYAVHSPKDFDESSASGSAELNTKAGKNEAGVGNFGIDIEIKLGWLLNKVIGGSLRYQSQGLIGPNGPQTVRYSEKIGDRPERWLEVDREKRTMKSSQVASLSLAPGTQDRLSVMWLLSMLARSDPAILEKTKTFSVPMFTFRQVYPAFFESYGPAVLVAPAGVLQTLHVAYKSQEAGGDRVDMWLGYDYDMQPVRIRWQEAQGRVIDMILQKKP